MSRNSWPSCISKSILGSGGCWVLVFPIRDVRSGPALVLQHKKCAAGELYVRFEREQIRYSVFVANDSKILDRQSLRTEIALCVRPRILRKPGGPRNVDPGMCGCASALATAPTRIGTSRRRARGLTALLRHTRNRYLCRNKRAQGNVLRLPHGSLHQSGPATMACRPAAGRPL